MVAFAAIDPFAIVELLGECIGHECVHTHTGTGEKFIDQPGGVRFAPHVLLHELFCFGGPRIIQDFVHVPSDAGEKLIDVVNSARFIPAYLSASRCA